MRACVCVMCAGISSKNKNNIKSVAFEEEISCWKKTKIISLNLLWCDVWYFVVIISIGWYLVLIPIECCIWATRFKMNRNVNK